MVCILDILKFSYSFKIEINFINKKYLKLNLFEKKNLISKFIIYKIII